MSDNIEAFARERHKNEYRRDGITPYVTHLERVAKRAESMGISAPEKEKLKQIGWLHDGPENFVMTLDEIVNILHVDNAVYEAVKALTHSRFVSYDTYINNLKNNELAKKVKIADILDNLSDNPRDKQIVKYARALLILMGKEE
jgi:hypothetical protein